MNSEQSINLQENEHSVQSAFADILYVLRAHILLILIVTALFGAVGYFYANTREPVYTASVPVQFEVQIFKAQINGSENSGKELVDQVSSTNYLFAYMDTAVGFCRSGEVLDRANVYYNYYKNSGKKIDDFVNELNDRYADIKSTRGEIPLFEVTDERKAEFRDKWFKPSNIGTSYSSDKNGSSITFKLWVRDLNRQTSIEMARIYALAADVALNRKVDFGSATSGLVDLSKSSSGVSVGADMPTNRIILIAAFIGFVFSLAIIYILYLLDNTLKSKEQLEEITGANVIAYLDDVAEAR